LKNEDKRGVIMSKNRNKLLQDLQKAQIDYAKDLIDQEQKDPDLPISELRYHSSQLAKVPEPYFFSNPLTGAVLGLVIGQLSFLALEIAAPNLSSRGRAEEAESRAQIYAGLLLDGLLYGCLLGTIGLCANKLIHNHTTKELALQSITALSVSWGIANFISLILPTKQEHEAMQHESGPNL
jgi:hypothetical protein